MTEQQPTQSTGGAASLFLDVRQLWQKFIANTNENADTNTSANTNTNADTNADTNTSTFTQMLMGANIDVTSPTFVGTMLVIAFFMTAWLRRANIQNLFKLAKMKDDGLQHAVALWHRTKFASGRAGMTFENLANMPSEIRTEFAWKTCSAIMMIQNVNTNRLIAQNIVMDSTNDSLSENLLFSIIKRAIKRKLNFLDTDTIDGLRHAKPKQIMLFASDITELALTTPVPSWIKEMKRVKATHSSAQVFKDNEILEIMGHMRQTYCACIFFLFAASHLDYNDFKAGIYKLDDFLIRRSLPTRMIAEMTPANFEQAMIEFYDIAKNVKPIEASEWFTISNGAIQRISKQFSKMYTGTLKSSSHDDDEDDSNDDSQDGSSEDDDDGSGDS